MNMKKGWTLACAAALVFFTAGTSMAANAAATFYVSQSSGNDANDGKTAATAWKTLARASEATYASGDKILLKCGDTWGNGTLKPNGSGTSENPIMISFYGTGNKPILDGLDDQQDRMGIYQGVRVLRRTRREWKAALDIGFRQDQAVARMEQPPGLCHGHLGARIEEIPHVCYGRLADDGENDLIHPRS
jgi:hypothetical protein